MSGEIVQIIDDLERENARLRAALDSCTAALEEEQELHSEALAEIARLQVEMEAMKGEENG